MNKPQHQQGVQSYAADEDNPGTPIVRIRDPGPADVLCGRGGGINAHEGNAAFRELVKEQKRRYNLAAKKDEKAEISQTIVDHIKSKNGRFLQRDTSQPFATGGGTKGWWVEITNDKAMSKTSQALREGAPSIRAKAADVPGSSKSLKKRSLSSDEEVVHPIIRGMTDGRRGKHLIPVKKQKLDERHLNSTPPPEISQDSIVTPTSMLLNRPDDHGPLLPQLAWTTAAAAAAAATATTARPLHVPNLVVDPASLPAHPASLKARMHSLASFGDSNGVDDEEFRGDESFADPFENEEERLTKSSSSQQDDDISGISNLNRILFRAKSSSGSSGLLRKSSDSGNNVNGNGNGNGNLKKPSQEDASSKSAGDKSKNSSPIRRIR